MEDQRLGKLAPMPWQELKAKLDSSVPQDASRTWELLGELMVPDGRITILDPSLGIYPDIHPAYLLVLEALPKAVSVYLEWLQPAEDELYVSAAAIIFSELPVTHQEVVGEVAVDTGTLAIAPTATLQERWRVGGPLSEAGVYAFLGDKWSDDLHRQVLERAVDVLQKVGFELRTEDGGYLTVRLVQAVTDQGVERGNQELQRVNCPAEVAVSTHHSLAVINNQLENGYVAYLDSLEEPYLFAFTPGWGDGTYQWFRLFNNDQVIGYLSTFIE